MSKRGSCCGLGKYHYPGCPFYKECACGQQIVRGNQGDYCTVCRVKFRCKICGEIDRDKPDGARCRTCDRLKPPPWENTHPCPEYLLNENIAYYQERAARGLPLFENEFTMAEAS